MDAAATVAGCYWSREAGAVRAEAVTRELVRHAVDVESNTPYAVALSGLWFCDEGPGGGAGSGIDISKGLEEAGR